jgi:hypothetical protein
MSYGELKIDTITFTAGGVDASVSVSGLVQNPTFTGNITTTGTISGDVIRGNTVSGATVTGDAGEFGNLTAVSGVFTTQVSGATVTGDVGLFGTITGGIHTLTSGVFASGTAANPSITFVDDLDTGIYASAANEVAISTNGTGRLFVDSSGRVGIGTSSFASDSRLEVSGATSSVVRIISATSSFGALTFGDTDDNSTGGIVYDHSDDSLALYGHNNTERARIDSSGRLLVGTTTSVAVDNAGTTFNSEFQVAGSSASVTIARNIGSGNLFLVRNQSVSDGSPLGFIGFQGGDGTDLIQGASIQAGVDGAPSTGSMPGRLVFSTSASGSDSPTERMRIDSSGRVGIGTTSPGTYDDSAGGSVLSLGATGTARSTINLVGATTTADEVLGRFNFTHASTTNTSYRGAAILGLRGSDNNSMYLRFDTANSGDPAERMRIDSTGRLLVGTTSFSGTANNDNDAGLIVEGNGSDGGGDGRLFIARGAASLSDGQVLGALAFSVSNHDIAAAIEAERDGGTWTAGSSQPTRLVFSTTADGAASPTERMRISSDGVTQIQKGTDNGHILTVTGGSSSRGLTIDTAAATVVGITANDSEVIFDAQTNISGTVFGTFSFRTGGGERLRIQRLGGISFNGDTAAANALDDYEEGTWTPAATGSWSGFASSTVTVATATYIKIGRAVHIQANMTFPDSTGNLTGGDYVQLDGLPFNYGGTGDAVYSSIPSQIFVRDQTNGGVSHGYLISSNSIGLRVVAVNGTAARNQTGLKLSFTYFTD